MQQHLKLKALVALVLDIEHRLQTIFCECHTIHQAEIVRPSLLRIVADLRVTEAEIELDAVVTAGCELAGFGGRGAKVLPVRVAGEAVLGELAGRVVFGWGAECLE